jgi:hypothetical protein
VDPGCATAKLEDRCDTEGAECGGPCNDPCAPCNIIRCGGGHWYPGPAQPAGCFYCGDGKYCTAPAQYCEWAHQLDAGGPGTFDPGVYACKTVPNACMTTSTCACMESHLAANSCATTGGGKFSIERLNP